jgi:hypothetical protein
VEGCLSRVGGGVDGCHHSSLTSPFVRSEHGSNAARFAACAPGGCAMRAIAGVAHALKGFGGDLRELRQDAGGGPDRSALV